MSDDRKTIASFLATINPILKARAKTEIDLELHRERCLEYPPTETSYDDQFPSVDLCDLQLGDDVFIHYFITTEGATVEGFCLAKMEKGKLIVSYVNVDSIRPPLEPTQELVKSIEDFVTIIIVDSLNQYLKS